MKVKVFSVFKEGRSLVARRWDKDGKLYQSFRDFRPKNQKATLGECYMTPEEAEFLVESPENQKRAADGNAHYWYPTGFPVPVPDDKDGFFAPAMDDSMTAAIDPRQVEAARKIEEEKQASMKQAQAEHDAQFADGNNSSQDAPARSRSKKGDTASTEGS